MDDALTEEDLTDHAHEIDPNRAARENKYPCEELKRASWNERHSAGAQGSM
jgi:hypothetical protein